MQKGLFAALSALLCLQEAAGRLVAAPSTLGKAGAIQGRAPPKDKVLAELERMDDFANLATRAPIRNDCFFVTTAHLSGASIEDLSRGSGISVPPPERPGEPGRGGVGIKEMVKVFDRLGLKYKVWKYSWYDQFDGRTEALAMPPKNLPRVVGVAYRRPDGSGHVVVCSNPGTPYRRYRDYQASPSGTDVTEEVRKSRIFAYFHIDKESSKVEFMANLGEQIAAMEREANQYGEPMEVEPFLDEELALLIQGTVKGELCKRALRSNLFSTENPQSKRSITGGSFLRARADEDCEKARKKAEELIEEDQKAAKKETELANANAGEEGTVGTPGEGETTNPPGEEKAPGFLEQGELPKTIDDPKAIELTQKTSDEVFMDLFTSRKIGKQAAKWGVQAQDVRKTLSGYEPLTAESPKFKLSTGKLATEGVGTALWVVGVVHAFTTNTTGLERASAVAAILPFIGCGFSALAEDEVDIIDKMMCIYADILLLTPLAPFGFVVHAFRGIVGLYKPKELPKAEDVQANRDKRWARFLDDKVFTYFYSDDSVSKNRAFRDKLNGTLFADDLAVVSDAADRIATANISARISLQTKDADKAQIQAAALNATDQIKAEISPLVIRRQREYLLKLPNRIKEETQLSLKPIAEQFNKEAIEHITSEAMVKDLTPRVPKLSDDPSTAEDHLEDSIRGKLGLIGEHLAKTPPPLPKLFDIAYVLGQSKGMLDIDALVLSPQEFIKSQAPQLSQDDLDFYSLHHALQISLLLRGKITEDKLSNLWPSEDANAVRQLQLLLALKFGKVYDDQKVQWAQGFKGGAAGSLLSEKEVRFSTHPNIPPHGRDQESLAYLGLILDLGEERIKNIPRQKEVIGYSDLANDEGLIKAMIEHAKELFDKKFDAETVEGQ